MTDRELLEAAAKAAGIEWVDGHVDTGLRDQNGTVWNPLTNSGDAFEFAMKLRTPDRRTLWSRVDWWFREGDEAIVAALVGAALAPLCILLLEVWKWLGLI